MFCGGGKGHSLTIFEVSADTVRRRKRTLLMDTWNRDRKFLQSLPSPFGSSTRQPRSTAFNGIVPLNVYVDPLVTAISCYLRNFPGLAAADPVHDSRCLDQVHGRLLLRRREGWR